MKSEQRNIQASVLAGLSDIALGFILYLTGWGDTLWEKFHVYGALGMGFLFYAYWYTFLIEQGKKK